MPLASPISGAKGKPLSREATALKFQSAMSMLTMRLELPEMARPLLRFAAGCLPAEDTIYTHGGSSVELEGRRGGVFKAGVGCGDGVVGGSE